MKCPSIVGNIYEVVDEIVRVILELTCFSWFRNKTAGLDRRVTWRELDEKRGEFRECWGNQNLNGSSGKAADRRCCRCRRLRRRRRHGRAAVEQGIISNLPPYRLSGVRVRTAGCQETCALPKYLLSVFVGPSPHPAPRRTSSALCRSENGSGVSEHGLPRRAITKP